MSRVRAKRQTAPAVDILVQSELWRAEKNVAATLRRAIGRAAAAVSGRYAEGAELALVLADDAAVRQLNRDWRGHAKPTNVLSFPAAGAGTHGAVPLGDIVIAYETARREALAEGKPLKNHISHLAVHGFLHLVGYRHDGAEEAEDMEALERTILSALGMPDPYPD
jgi:probable rRNA maturation factor